MKDYTSIFDLTGKVALVIGAKYDGIGHAQALGLAQFGSDVIIAGEDSEDMGRISAEVQESGKKSAVLPVDVTSEESVRDMVKKVLEDFPRIDILVNDFSTRIRLPAINFPVDEWQKVMDINIRGCFICCKEDREVLDAMSAIPGQKLFVLDEQPTAEHLAGYLLHTVAPRELANTGVSVVRVQLWETENCHVDVSL